MGSGGMVGGEAVGGRVGFDEWPAGSVGVDVGRS